MNEKILIVEDDRDLAEVLKYSFEKEGFEVQCEAEGNLALPQVRRWMPDLLVLDLMLPGLDGFEICRRLRRMERYCSLPVLMLTARVEEEDRVVGLEIGADDYVTKPFSVRELVARVRALLRRREAASGLGAATIEAGALVIDPRAHRVSVSGAAVPVSALEFRLFHFLASNPEMVFSRDQLLDRVWGSERNVTPRSVDVCVRRLREKLAAAGGPEDCIETVHGVGYGFHVLSAAEPPDAARAS